MVLIKSDYRVAMMCGFRKTVCVAATMTMAIFTAVPAWGARNLYDATRMAWQWRERQFVCHGAYARAKMLHDGSLVLAYGTARKVYLKKYNPLQKTWGEKQLVAEDKEKKYDYTNAELTQLDNGRLVYSWNARPLKDTGKPYKIMLKTSDDGGKTWENEQDIYTAGTTFDEGCWEPVVMQIPGGETLLFYSDEYNVTQNRQNISVMRSADCGLTWKGPHAVSFRNISRDGMPVPVWLKNGSGTAMAIEDNGMNGTFKPAIVFSPAGEDWRGKTVGGKSKRRWSALCKNEALEKDVYGGAPYLIQLSGGETLLSIQSGEGRKTPDVLDHALMQVYVGNQHARNFGLRTTPFANQENPNINELWNALCQVDENTVIAVSTISGMAEKSGIWAVTGKVVRPMKSHRSSAMSAPVSTPLYIGSKSQACAETVSHFSDEKLVFDFTVTDSVITPKPSGAKLSDGDGVEIYIDTKMRGSKRIAGGMYKIIAGVDSKATFFCGTKSDWQQTETPVECTATRIARDKYRISVAIPWNCIGGMPKKKAVAVCFQLNNRDGENFIKDCLSGADCRRPDTWLRCTFD